MSYVITVLSRESERVQERIEAAEREIRRLEMLLSEEEGKLEGWKVIAKEIKEYL